MAATGAKYEPAHGTEARYGRGCRCAKCKSAKSAATRRRKEAKELETAVPVTPIGVAAAADGPSTGVQGAVHRLIQMVADDPATQVRAQMALELAKRLDKGDGAPAPIAAQLQVLMAGLKPVKDSGVVADGVAAPRLSALFGARGRVDPRGLPGSAGAAAVGDEA